MSRTELYDAIYHILKEKLALSHVSAFHEHARLNEDLYMDSIMVLQLILHIEIDLGFNIPDDAIVPKDFHTVGSLLSFLEGMEQNLGRKVYD
jgi:acyl carrier protein